MWNRGDSELLSREAPKQGNDLGDGSVNGVVAPACSAMFDSDHIDLPAQILWDSNSQILDWRLPHRCFGDV